ncbi:WAT1-related protein At4g08300-like [Silene latifolia]|uniref:WAT1-related protein At4g08300-like n=1 Tax=Silene latifolia TaxID=37657 RepID=UPI003D775790
MGGVLERFKPHILMGLVQVGYTILFLITGAAFKHGMNPHVYITYRQIICTLVMFPFAYVLERDVRPKLTAKMFGEIFLLALLGVGLALNLFFASLTYTSPTFVTAMLNSVASLTFVFALLLRLETVALRQPRGLAKVFGTLISLAGIMLMAFYKGSIIPNVSQPLVPIQQKTVIQQNWLKGSPITIAGCVALSLFYILQTYTLIRYPAQLSLTTWISAVGAVQTTVFTATIVRDPGLWRLGFNIDLWTAIYGGVFGSGLIIYIQLWCNKEKGPVFVTVFSPLSTILVAVTSFFILSEKLYIGSVIGAVVVIVGTYLFLWGKQEQKPKANTAQLPMTVP